MCPAIRPIEAIEPMERGSRMGSVPPTGALASQGIAGWPHRAGKRDLETPGSECYPV